MEYEIRVKMDAALLLLRFSSFVSHGYFLSSPLTINKKPEDLPTLRLDIVPVRARWTAYEPQPPPQDKPLVLQLAPDP